MNTVTRKVDFPDTSEEAIAEYLKSHPDFFEQHLTLLSGLRLPHRTTGGAISLVERQVDVLRQRNHALETKLRELIEVALPFALGARTRLDFGGDGVHCRIELPDHEWKA